MGSETLGFEVGARGEEVVEELSDDIEVVGTGELGDGDGEGDAVEVGVRGERSSAANVEDIVGVLFRF